MKKMTLTLFTFMFTFCSLHATAQETPASAPAPLSVAETEKAAIRTQAEAFSAAYIAGDIDGIMQVYTEDARIVPINGRILSDRASVRQLWASAIASPAKALSHTTEPDQLVIDGDTATDIGYYYGESRTSDGKRTSFGGAYVIIWKKTNGVWRKQTDMWNTVRGLKK